MLSRLDDLPPWRKTIIEAERAAFATLERVAALDRAATDYGATCAQTIEDAMVFLLDDDAHVLRRELHVRRRSPLP